MVHIKAIENDDLMYAGTVWAPRASDTAAAHVPAPFQREANRLRAYRVVSLTAFERTGSKSKGFKDFYLKETAVSVLYGPYFHDNGGRGRGVSRRDPRHPPPVASGK